MTTDNKKTDIIDVCVGKKITKRREALEITQEHLAKILGVSVTKLQQYETAEIKVTVSMLWRLGGILGVPIGFFFTEIGAGMGSGF